MILQVNRLKDIFSLADIDSAKLIRAINEAEGVDLRALLGATAYTQYVTDIEFRDKYIADTPERQGLEAATAYLAYSRYVRQNNVQSTVAGELYNSYVNSQQPDYRDKANNANYYREIGEAIINTINGEIAAGGTPVSEDSRPFKIRNL